jgi:hypothetical protein
MTAYVQVSRTPECRCHPRALAAGVREAPRHEIAGRKGLCFAAAIYGDEFGAAPPLNDPLSGLPSFIKLPICWRGARSCRSANCRSTARRTAMHSATGLTGDCSGDWHRVPRLVRARQRGAWRKRDGSRVFRCMGLSSVFVIIPPPSRLAHRGGSPSTRAVSPAGNSHASNRKSRRTSPPRGRRSRVPAGACSPRKVFKVIAEASFPARISCAATSKIRR